MKLKCLKKQVTNLPNLSDKIVTLKMEQIHGQCYFM